MSPPPRRVHPPRIPVPRRPTVVDLFSGAGGLSLGCEQAGMDVVASVEYDPICAAVHRFNFPRTATLCADASTLSAAKLKKAIEKGRAEYGHEVTPIVDVVV